MMDGIPETLVDGSSQEDETQGQLIIKIIPARIQQRRVKVIKTQWWTGSTERTHYNE